MAQHTEEEHYGQEDEKGEYHEIFHGVAVGGKAFFPVGMASGLGAGEDKRFVGEAECLQENKQHHGNLVVGAIDAKAVHCLGRVAHQRGI